MKRIRFFLICITVVSLLLLGACGSNVKSDETYRRHYVAAYRGVSTALGGSNNVNQDFALLVKSSHLDNFYVELQAAQERFETCYKPANENMLKGTRGFVYFLYLLYNNNVPITQEPITFDCDYVLNNRIVQDNTITLLSKVDLTNKIIVCDLVGVSVEANANRDTDKFYIHIEIDFDFNTLTVGDFILDMIGIIGDNLSFENGVSCLYKNGKVYTATKNDFGNKLEDYVGYVEETYYKPYKSLIVNAVKINQNYSKEYTESINKFVK